MNNKEAIKKYHKCEITAQQLVDIQAENLALSVERTGMELHMVEGKNPLYKDNRSRNQIAYSWRENAKGKFFQFVIKPLIIKAINYIHAQMIKRYDDQIFIYDDPRLIAINSFMTDYIETEFTHARPYKTEFMHKIKDIALGMAKEDKYYRSRLFDGINKFVKVFPYGFELTDIEKKNIETYH